MENNKKILVIDGETKATADQEVIWTVAARSWTHLVHKAS